MEHDSSRSGYHEPQPVEDGREGNIWDESTVESAQPQVSINLIWAQARSQAGQTGVIGSQGTMPWHLSEDLRRFADLTVSHPVIMGRKTWKSLGERYRPLPNRDNIVVSRDPHYKAPGATVVDSLEAAVGIAREEAIPDDGIDRSEIWVIGGGTLFDQCLDHATRAYVTEIDVAVDDGDVFAPDMSVLEQSGQWVRSETSEWQVPSKDSAQIPRFRYVRYDRYEGSEGE